MIKILLRRGNGAASWKAVMYLLCMFLLGLGSGHAAPAPNANSVLILGSTARNAASPSFIEGHAATMAGFTVVVASDPDWSAMTTADFASYRAIIFADGMCSGNSSFKAAIANQDVWAPAVTGNVIVMGNHPGTSALSATAAQDFVQNALQFAGATGTTGAYITLACYGSTTTQTDVPVLKPFGKFSVVQQNGCSDSVHLVASDPNLGALNDTNMSGWGCTTNAEFVNWDSSFTPFAVATNVSGQFIDPSTGASVSPYILVRGAQVTPLTTLQAAPSSPGTLAAEAMSVPVPGDPTVDLSMPMTSGTQSLYDGPVKGLLSGDGNWGLTGNLTATVSWSPNSDIAVQYDSNHMEQGDTPGTVDTLTPGHGNLCMNFNASFDVVLDGHSVGLGNVNNQSVCADCPLKADGTAYKCSLGEQKIEVLCVGLDLVDGCIDLTVTPTTFVTPQPFSTDRTLFYDGTAADTPSPSIISFPPNPVNDPVQLSCVEPVGTDVVYQLANPRTTAPLSDFGIELGIAGTLQEGICPACFQQTVIDDPNIVPLPLPAGGLTLSLTGPTGQVDLGAVQKETSVPDLTAVSTAYTGKEGSPIQFSANGARDKCLDSSSLVWNYSDHGVAYGFSPFHTFQDADVFSGQLVVTNIGGNTATKAFSVTVQNVPPTVTAGPDTTAAWGVPVAFNGSGTAAGSDDQATLTYSWAFGDGSPSATGGPSVSHAYSAPGTYTAILKVCDEDAFCSSASRQVIVRARNVTVGYLGDQLGVYNTLTNLSGSLVDELGHPVPGRTIVFAISTEAGGAAATSSTGGASTTHLLALPAGSYMASAAFAGDSLYNAAGPVYAAYTVSRKPTVVTYTGALNGGPNKTITLSAILVDSQNQPLAGRIIAFKLGSQSASATTNASGVAATRLALNQKNANYPLTATYTPLGADTNLYLGSVASATFKLQVK